MYPDAAFREDFAFPPALILYYYKQDYYRFIRSRFYRGAVAQLGERLTGSQEVRGSIPLGSTSA